MESTATWYWLGHSKYIMAISYAKVKTDAVDAHTLAQRLKNDLVPAGHMISAVHREERDLLRARLPLVQQQVRCRATVEGSHAQPLVLVAAEHLRRVGSQGGRGRDAAGEARNHAHEQQNQTASAKLTAWWGTDYLLLAKYDGRWMIRQVLWQSPPR